MGFVDEARLVRNILVRLYHVIVQDVSTRVYSYFVVMVDKILN